MENIKTLFEYHNWATNRMLNYIEALCPEWFNKEVDSVFSSIRETMEHMYTVDKLWFDRLQGRMGVNNNVSFINSSEAVVEFNKLHILMLRFVKESNLKHTVYYKNSLGDAFENSVQDIYYHLVNHGTYHRGNITAMIRTMGSNSISTDFIFYLREKE
jgi:uncharacterized damage-inducible protein DinB